MLRAMKRLPQEHPPAPRGTGLALGALAFVMFFHYDVVRPVTDAMFTHDLGYERLPWAWLGVAVTAGVVTAGYNSLTSRFALMPLLAVASLTSAALLAVLLMVRQAGVAGSSYALYIWKDVHIVVLAETFWMFANAAFPSRSAARLYGLFCAAGSTGAALGNRAARALLSQGWSTTEVLWAGTGLLVVLAAGALGVHRLDRIRARAADDSGVTERPPWWSGFRDVRAIPLLGWMLLLVVTTQLVINLVDYRFNGVVQSAYPGETERAAAMSVVYEAISWGALATQVLTGPVLALLGLRVTVLTLPLLVGGAAGAMLVAPRFVTAAVAKVMTKVVDYGWFRATKEMLYIPLAYGPRARGKAVIDILGYRGAKAGASLLVLGLGALAADAGVDFGLAALFVVWVVAAWRILRAHARAEASLADDPTR